ncbi:MAG: precorrin-6A/cobalt-precorrin-6A reductase [Cyanobium sp. Prado107]|jgi:precorrin-6A/cobalt-precorrin-6A reductase|nr:precorrin-6A/cobalt-precorrin-6A reductase [Cyanobium sp. Prado107]
MHDTPARQQHRRLWLFSGTGEGPPLAERLLALGWRVRLSVLTSAAADRYPAHPGLELRVGRLGGAAGLARQLLQARELGEPFTVVVDATHPFASRIQAELVQGSAAAAVPLLRLERNSGGEVSDGGTVQELADLPSLGAVPLAGTRLLLAIGSRHLAEALRCSPGALHHARVLPEPAAVRQALAAGLAPERLAPLHPRTGAEPPTGRVEAALVRRWGIAAILARASGPPTETLWRRVAAAEGCRLLLLRRPQRQSSTTAGLSAETLLQTLAAWDC